MKSQEPDDRELSSDEIRKEFQLERMVLFSDAVFAIVITLMAIELKFPEELKIRSDAELLHELRHLAPVFLSYLISFIFIGVTWARHLQLFSRIKDYDSGLVVRNLILLFFIGMFPFAASLFMKYKGLTYSYTVYFVLLFLCLLAQQNIHHYVFVKRPNLRRNVPVHKQVAVLKVLNVTLIGFFMTIVAISLSPMFVKDPEDRSLVFIAFMVVTGAATRIARAIYFRNLPTS